ncbi:MAG: family 20 glycosylhydrolase [Gemmatimonadetes bacterium]|nr:family 20 glycosylhydrolase [Gemmatimonadota bacterium]
MPLHPVHRAFALATLLAASVASAQDARLIPAPREISTPSASVRFRGPITFAPLAETDDRAAAREFADAMRERGYRAEVTPVERGWTIAVHRVGSDAAADVLRTAQLVFDDAMRDEGYVLAASDRGASIVAASDAGVFYALQTLKQLFTGAGEQAMLTPALIRDWPAMRWRGVQDDLSRGPVPTLEYQKRQIRLFAAYKINVYSPYFEHTLQFASNPVIAPPGGSMSRADVQALVEFAQRYHITVVPQQQTFGHLHHMLKLELYAPLAETSHGHVLAPGQPGSLEFTKTVFAEIDSMFPSPFVHLGADETFELGKGQTRARVDSAGMGQVYLEYLRDIEGTLRRPGKRFLFWGDIAMRQPQLVPLLPKDMIAVGWEYAASRNFDRFLKPFRDAGMETWIAPGVTNWNRVWPNNNIALANIQGFAREGQAGGATGMLNTQWDDNGDAIFEQVWLGIVFGAAAAWQAGESDLARFRASYGLQFHGDTTGRIDAAHRHLDAAQAALQESRAGDASSYLFFVDPYSDEGVFDLIRLRPVLSRVRVHAESALVLIAQARQQRHLREVTALDAMELGARRIDWLAAKFQFADEIAMAYARADSAARAGTATWLDLAELSGINGRLQDMRDGYVLTRELFERAWRAENRPYWLQNNLARYDAEILTWVQRTSAMDRARRRFTREQRIPPPEELGIPRALLPASEGGATVPPRPAPAARGTPPSRGRTGAP